MLLAFLDEDDEHGVMMGGVGDVHASTKVGATHKVANTAKTHRVDILQDERRLDTETHPPNGITMVNQCWWSVSLPRVCF